VAGAIHGYLESFVVIVAAGLAFRHGVPLIKLMSEQTIDSCCRFHFSPRSLRFFCMFAGLPRRNNSCDRRPL
jgi:hypothetical protein